MNDKYYNDATWNVVYVDSHDYAPDEVQFNRFSKPQDVWAENLSLMFTHRGIPCIFYGSEVEFQKGKRIDEGTNIALQNSGRAYFGGYIKGTVHTTEPRKDISHLLFARCARFLPPTFHVI